jgi:uroporphyrinogen decarboxylase
MTQTPREIVQRCLRFQHPERLPRELWALPWAETRYPAALAEMRRRFPSDVGWSAHVYRNSPKVKGDAMSVGEYVDEWGCTFTNNQAGVIGEIKTPIIADIADWKSVAPPYDTLPADPSAARDQVNRACAASPFFIRAGCCPRPCERYQFLRGSENALADVMTPEDGGGDLLRKIHEFFVKEVEFWASTDVDSIMFMDDWGSQRQLLIRPQLWRTLFKPLYKDYCDIAHAHGKAVFMHSDGHIAAIMEDLVEIGVDAVNSQLFCMDMADLAKRVKGRITFWGEIDRQHVLPAGPEVGREAVRKVARHLYDPAGGIIVQFEFGPAGNPDTAIAIFEEWEKVDAEGRKK